MGYAPGGWQTVVLNNGATDSTAIDLGRVFDLLDVDFPAMNSCSISLKASRSAAGTYNVLGVGTPAAVIGTGSLQEVFKIGGHQFIKLVSSVTQNAARSILYRGIGL